MTLVFVGALMSAVGGILASVRQSLSGNEASAIAAKTLDAAQDAAARAGNAKTQQELIELRSRLLVADRSGSDPQLADVVAKLPKMVDDYQKLNSDKEATMKAMETDLALCYTPYINAVLGEIERQVSNLKKLDVGKNTGYQRRPEAIPTTLREGQSAQREICFVSMNGVELAVIYQPMVVLSDGMRAGSFAFYVRGGPVKGEDRPFITSFDVNSASVGNHTFQKFLNGAPPPEAMDELRKGIHESLARFLVVASATKN